MYVLLLPSPRRAVALNYLKCQLDFLIPYERLSEFVYGNVTFCIGVFFPNDSFAFILMTFSEMFQRTYIIAQLDRLTLT